MIENWFFEVKGCLSLLFKDFQLHSQEDEDGHLVAAKLFE